MKATIATVASVRNRRMSFLAMVMVMAAACTDGDGGAEALPESDARPGVSDDFEPLEDVPLADSEPGSGESEYSWRVLSSGAGGFVTGLDSTIDGSVRLARTDVGGMYRWIDGERVWEQLIDAEGVSEPELQDYQVEAMAIAPSDVDRFYISTGSSVEEPTGRILTSADGGQTWTATAQEFAINGNGEWRTSGERIAVDPADPDVVLLGTRTEGLWRSTDGAVTFTKVESVPEGTIVPERERQGPAGVLFVVWSADGDTVWAGVSGVGVLASTDRGQTFSTVAASEGMPFDAEEAVDGRLWVAERDPGRVLIIDGGTVTDVAPQDRSFETISVDPFDPQRAIVGGVGIVNDLWITENGGTDWQRMDVSTSCPGIDWLDQYPNDFLPTGSIRFDRQVPDQVWVPEGFAVWLASVDGNRFEMTCETDGIEELVSNDVIVPPGGEPITAHWDRALFWHGGDGSGDAVVHPANRFNSGWDLDWSPADPDVVVAVIGDQRGCCRGEPDSFLSAVSNDGGRSWTPFGSYERGHPEGLVYGNIALSADDPDNIVWLPSFNGPPHYSTDGGDTWTPVILPGTADIVTQRGVYAGGSHFQYYLNRKALAADRIQPATFYLYHRFGMFRSTDGGQSWELLASEGLPIGGVGQFNVQLAVSPSTAGHLLFSTGTQDGVEVPFHESRDGGETWRAVPGIADVTAIGFGAPLGGATTPAVYVAGSFGGQRGLWRSSDDLATWDLISEAPAGNYQAIRTLTGDPDEPGTVYVGFSGTSFIVGRVEPMGEGE
jgi:hypothetical protein